MKKKSLKDRIKGNYRSLATMLALSTALTGCSFGNSKNETDHLVSQATIEDAYGNENENEMSESFLLKQHEENQFNYSNRANNFIVGTKVKEDTQEFSFSKNNKKYSENLNNPFMEISPSDSLGIEDIALDMAKKVTLDSNKVIDETVVEETSSTYSKESGHSSGGSSGFRRPAPETTPEETSPSTPETTPEETSPSIPETTPEETSPTTPETTPEETLPTTPETTPEETSPSASETTSEETLPSTSETTPEETLPSIPETTPEETLPPETTPEETLPSIPETTPEETSSEHLHVWGDWTYINELEEGRTCLECGEVMKQNHDFTTTIDTVSNQDATHNVTSIKTCGNCGYTHSDFEVLDCDFSDWKFIGENQDSRSCLECGYEDSREHIHTEKPTDLEYVVDASNKNGTHSLTATYLCDSCHETVTLSKNEDCDYEVTYKHSGVNDTHIEVKDCTICNDHQEKDQTCTPDGVWDIISVNGTIYDFQRCIHCNDWTLRKYHTEHVFGPWEYYDYKTHKKYCKCLSEDLGGRVTEKHNFTFDMIEDEDDAIEVSVFGFACDDCGFSKEVPEHKHAKDNIDLMDLVLSPYYDRLVSKSQESNPHPDPEDYCSSYEAYCRECGVNYLIKYPHKFKDGKCTRGYCGHIEDPNYMKEEAPVNFLSSSAPDVEEASPSNPKRKDDYEELSTKSNARRKTYNHTTNKNILQREVVKHQELKMLAMLEDEKKKRFSHKLVRKI